MNFFELPILTVSALTQSVKVLLEAQFRFIGVQGEISNCKLQSSGHLYFSLKDSQSQIAAVMFKGDAAVLSKLPKDGDQVIVKGALNVYPPSGKYQIVVRSLEWAGLGALLLKLAELKEKLKARGFFDQERKKLLPKFPKRIGVVTSPTGAVIQDILHVLSRRFAGFHLILNPVKVQGEGAAQEIAAAIDFFNKHQLVDVLIVGRGGGSIEDLWAFNEEIVADAIYRSKIPIISAVGHESDHCIADEVSDVRAPTPSAAAEIAIAEKTHQIKHVAQLQRAIIQTTSHLLRHARERLQSVRKHPLLLTPYTFLGFKMQRMDDLKSHLDRQMLVALSKFKFKLSGIHRRNELLNPQRKIEELKMRFRFMRKNLDDLIKRKQLLDRKHLTHTTELLRSFDPRNILKRGYSIVISEKTSSIIHSIHSLSEGDRIKLLFTDGTVHSTINEIDKL